MSFFAELKRRNVVKVSIAYVVAAWLLLQLTEVLTELLDLPDVAGRFVVLILIIGFIPAVIFAWAFEMTPEGIKREAEVDRSQSITRQTGRKLDFTIIAMLVVIAGYFIWESRFAERGAITSEVTVAEAGHDSATAGEPLNSQSIAVLPFANRSMQQEDLFFTDGIHDDLLTQLAKIDDLKVISRTSVMEYRDTTKKIPEIAAELGVSKILEGGVQRAGQRIRINAQLIDVNTDEHLWAETFDREMTVDNIFDIQSEITRQIVQAVRGELTPDDQLAIAETPTDNLEAYEAFLRARAAANLSDYGRDKYLAAEPWARKAVELDPQFTQAWVLLAHIHGQAVWIGYDNSPERQAEARAALENAVALAPDDPQVIAAQADLLYRLDNDYAASYELYKKASLAAPGDSMIMDFKAVNERRLGMWEQSIKTFEKAHDLDPANVFYVATMADTLARMNAWDRLEPLLNEWLVRFPESRDLMGLKVSQLMHTGDLRAAREVFDRIPPTDSSIYFRAANALPRWERNYDAWIAAWDLPELDAYSFSAANMRELALGQAYLFKGETERARELFGEYVEKMSSRQANTLSERGYALALMGVAHAYLGESEKALELARQANEIQPREKDALFGSSMYRNQTLTIGLTGDHETAIDRLAENLDQPESLTSWELQLDPVWDFLRDNERFNQLIAHRQIREESP